MSKTSDLARLEFVEELIANIEEIIQRHGGILESLRDMEGKHALLMCLQQIGENLGRLENPDWKLELEGKEASLMRNIIAHDYMGVKLSLVQKTIEVNIPLLRSKINQLIR